MQLHPQTWWKVEPLASQFSRDFSRSGVLRCLAEKIYALQRSQHAWCNEENRQKTADKVNLTRRANNNDSCSTYRDLANDETVVLNSRVRYEALPAIRQKAKYDATLFMANQLSARRSSPAKLYKAK